MVQLKLLRILILFFFLVRYLFSISLFSHSAMILCGKQLPSPYINDDIFKESKHRWQVNAEFISQNYQCVFGVRTKWIKLALLFYAYFSCNQSWGYYVNFQVNNWMQKQAHLNFGALYLLFSVKIQQSSFLHKVILEAHSKIW